MSDAKNLPTIADLTQDVDLAFKNDQLNLLLNQSPPASWVKEHPFIKGYKYLPIDKVELMMKRIFKRYRIEITNQGTAFNGVWVTVRLHYMNPTDGQWEYQDGIGGAQMQTAKGTSPSDLININNGALSMAFPIAKTLAVKDAADLIGKIFGADLNRKDVVDFQADKNLQFDWEELQTLYVKVLGFLPENEATNCKRIIDGKETANYKKCLTVLNKYNVDEHTT